MNGKERRNLKSMAKIRPIDLKIGKRGLTETFLDEARKILSRDGMIKFSHSLVREIEIILSRKSNHCFRLI